jgi:hypothetical protein
MRYLLFLLLSATFYACSLPAGWEEIDTKGLPERAWLSSVMFDNDSVTYAATYAPNIGLYKSNNKCKDWKTIPTGGLGNYTGPIDKIFAFNGKLVVLVQTTSEFSDFILTYESGKWDTIYQSSNGFDIDNIYFETADKGFAFVKKSNAYGKRALISINGSATNMVAETPYEYYNSYFSSDTAYSFESSKKENAYLATSLKTGRQYVHKLEAKAKIKYVAVYGNDELLYVTEENKKSSITINNKQISMGEYADYTIKSVFANKNVIMAIGYMDEADRITEDDYFFVSKDAGKTWVKEKAPVLLSAGKCHLYNDNSFIGIGYMNAIYLRK